MVMRTTSTFHHVGDHTFLLLLSVDSAFLMFSLMALEFIFISLSRYDRWYFLLGAASSPRWREKWVTNP